MLNRIYSFTVFLSILIFSYGCTTSEMARKKVDSLMAKNYQYFQEGNIQEHIKVLEEILTIVDDKDYSNALYGTQYRGGNSGKISLYNELGNKYFTLSKYDIALEYYKKSKLIADEKKMDDDIPRIHNYMARVYILLGNYQKVINLLKNQFEKKKSDKIGETLISAYIGNNELENALKVAKKVFASRFKHNNDTSILDCEKYNLLGSMYLTMKNYTKALEYYSYPLSVAEEQINIDNTQYSNYTQYIMSKLFGMPYKDLAMSHFNIGMVYYQMKDYFKAIEYFTKALNFSANQHYLPKIIQTNIRTYLAWSILESNNYKNVDNSKVLSLFQQAIDIKLNLYGEKSLYENYQGLSAYYGTQKMTQKSYQYMKKAYDIYINNRHSNFILLNSLDKQNYLKMKGTPVLNLLDTAYQYNSNVSKKQLSQTTFNDWLNNKGAVLDSENMMTTFQNNTSDKQLKEEIDTLRQKQRYLAVLKQQYPDDNIKFWKQKIQSLENEIDNLTQNISKSVKNFSEEQELQLISYDEIVSNLKEEEFYIDYAKSEEYYYIFTVDKAKNVSFIQIDESETKKIDSLIKAFREEIVEFKNLNKYQKLTQKQLQSFQNSSQRILSELYRLLIEKPLGNKVEDKKSLVVSTDGILRLLPFEALYNSTTQKYLVEAFDIKYIPSGKEFIRLHRYTKNERSYSNKVIVFANPDFEDKSTDRGDVINFTTSRTWKALMGTKAEAEFIQKTFDDVKVYEQEQANEIELLNIKQPKILHIATHGFFINDSDIENPMLKSGLVLSGANISAEKGRDYGFVTALKLSGFNLRGTDLVVLSACETGVVDVNDTDSISGLGKAFIQAGAKDVVMSLWSVDDNATKELMIDFYRGIKEHSNYSRALREAKLKMIDEGQHPFYWGGFVLNGL